MLLLFKKGRMNTSERWMFGSDEIAIPRFVIYI